MSILNKDNSITIGYEFFNPKTKKFVFIRKNEKWKLFRMRMKLRWYKLIGVKNPFSN